MHFFRRSRAFLGMCQNGLLSKKTGQAKSIKHRHGKHSNHNTSENADPHKTLQNASGSDCVDA